MIDRAVAAQMRRDGATYQQIGDAFGVSRQRVQQVLKNQVRLRKCSTDMEKIVYEGIYNYLMDHPRMTFPSLAMVMFGNSGNNENNLVQNLLRGRSCKISKRAYDRLIAATGMTYEQLFKLRDGFKEEDDEYRRAIYLGIPSTDCYPYYRCPLCGVNFRGNAVYVDRRGKRCCPKCKEPLAGL